MACPKCDHTMQLLLIRHLPQVSTAVYWCPRCGSVRLEEQAEVKGQEALRVEKWDYSPTYHGFDHWHPREGLGERALKALRAERET